MTAEAETMWRTLARLTLEGRQLYIAERCFAALGDVSKVRYLQGINHIRQLIQENSGDKGNLSVFSQKCRTYEVHIMESISSN